MLIAYLHNVSIFYKEIFIIKNKLISNNCNINTYYTYIYIYIYNIYTHIYYIYIYYIYLHYTYIYNILYNSI